MRLDLPVLPVMAYQPVWNECINVGNIYEMSLANTQFHVLYLQEQLHIRYVRIWNIFSVRMMISDGETVGVYNFDLLNQVLDFLVQHRIRPFLDFGRRPDTAVRSEGDEIYYQEEYIRFRSRRVWEDLFATFLDEVVNRYGAEEVSTWIFELGRDQFHDPSTTQEYEAQDYDFFTVWSFFYHTLREKIPGAMLGGISTILEDGLDFTSQFYRRCVREGCVPDFASFFLYPYEKIEVSKNGLSGRSLTVNMNLELEKVQRMRALMEETGLGNAKLFITEWNNSISNRNYLNDSCFRAAYLCAKITQLWGRTDLMAVMSATDWISSFFDTNKILYGAIGLLTKDLIHKPAFYALFFLKQMGPQFLAKGEHFLLTRKPSGSLYLLCFYFSWPRSSPQDGEGYDLIKLRNVRYEEERVLNLQMELLGFSHEREYTVKKRMLNGHSGSVLDEWGKFGYETRLNREDIKYLRSVSVPRIEMERVRASEEDSLLLSICLHPQEVALLHIYKGAETA